MKYAYAKPNTVYKLKGYSKKITQLVENGNFANGLTNWEEANATYSISNNELTFTPSAIYGGVTSSVGTPMTKGDKLVYIAEIKANKNCYVFLGARVSHPEGRLISGDYNYAITTSYKKIAIFATVEQTITHYIAISQNSRSDFPTYTIRQFQCFNLTKDFGAGKEPTTIAQCEEYYGNKYIPYGEQILNCKMPIKAYKDGLEVATIDFGHDLVENEIETYNTHKLQDNLTFTDANGYEIEVVGKTMKVEKHSAVKKSKNLFDKNQVNLVYGEQYKLIVTRRVLSNYVNDWEWEDLQNSKYIGKTFTISYDIIAHKDFVDTILVYPYQNNGLCIYSGDLYINNLKNGERRRIVYTGTVECRRNNDNYSRGELMNYPLSATDRVNGNFDIENVQIEEGSTATSYEPYGIIKYKATTI